MNENISPRPSSRIQARTTLMRIDDLEILVEAVELPDDAPAGIRLDAASGAALDAFDTAQSAILALGRRAAVTARELIEQSQPLPGEEPAPGDHDRTTAQGTTGFEMEFGLAFTTGGRVILVGAEATASVKVKFWHHR